ncbi:outer membrane protein [Paenochrobactrum sp. BZR 588]|uniref:outer membrane protein n=1 Tax=Paenochrobactrum TaxID=999488 RepID=UPI0035BC84D1
MGIHKLSEVAKLSFAVENLTDVYYVEPLSLTRIPSPGRTLRVGFTTDFSSSSPKGWADLDNANAYDWSGLYAGLHLGGGTSSYQMADFTTNGENALVYNFGNADTTIAGVHLGYDYQFANNFVVSIGGEYSFTNLRKGGFETPELNGATYKWDSKPRIDQIKLGINYRF